MHQYLIRVEGRMPDDALDDFVNLSVAPQGVQTVLYGDLPDQAALTGILDRLADMGVMVVEVLQVPAAGGRPEQREANEPPTPRGQFG